MKPLQTLACVYSRDPFLFRSFSCTKMTDKIPKPPPNTPDSDDFTNQWPFELSDYINFDDNQWMSEDFEPVASQYVSNQVHQASNVGEFGGGSSHSEGSSSRDTRSGHERREVVRERFAFKILSEIEVLDDGYRWRKYGKKMVKNSPHPRNYYRCSVDGCNVKKIIERDRDDPSGNCSCGVDLRL